MVVGLLGGIVALLVAIYLGNTLPFFYVYVPISLAILIPVDKWFDSTWRGTRSRVGSVINPPLPEQICSRYGSLYVPPEMSQKVGIALDSLAMLPLNALRHAPENETCGWYIWGGTELPQDSIFFQPLHVSHLGTYCPELTPYLGLAPGWRILLAPGRVDVWFDENLLEPR